MLGFGQSKDCAKCGYLLDTVHFLTEKVKDLTGACKVCYTYQEEIKFLRAQLDELKTERREERDEYKRAVDRLLERQEIPALGQGPTHHREASLRDLNGLFSFEVEGDAVRKLGEAEQA